MGEYFFVITVPPNTSASSPAEYSLNLEGDFLAEIAYLIPHGWCALAGFAIYYGIKQIYPEWAGKWVTGDGVYRTVPLNMAMPEERYKLTVKAYNIDEVYAHSLYLWIRTTSAEEGKVYQPIYDFIKWFKRLLTGEE